MEALIRLRNRLRPRGWGRWLSLASLAIVSCQLLASIGAFSPLFSPLIYPQLAPAGWHNITPHGNIILNGFGVSTTTPGLMAACATSFSVDVRDPSTWNLGGFRFWVSRNGGASWQAVHPPLAGGAYCEAATGLDGSVAFSMDYGQIHYGNWTSTTTWVTRDFGRTWQHPAPDPSAMIDGQSVPVTPLVRRTGTLYGLYSTHDQYGDDALAVSSDDGTTWHALPTTPSDLEKQGWRNSNFLVDNAVVPDYRGDHLWYRVLYADGKVSMLENSMNDGQSWTAVGPIGSADSGVMLLAVNASQPDRLCADSIYSQTDHIELRSSTDGGQTWRGGTMPTTYLHTVGVNSFWPVMDAQGSCYTGYHFGRGGPQYEGNNGSYCAVMRLSPGADALQALPLGGYCALANGDPVDITYVPAGNGMSGRLVIQGEIANAGWPAVASGIAGETDEDKVIWTAVP